VLVGLKIIIIKINNSNNNNKHKSHNQQLKGSSKPSSYSQLRSLNDLDERRITDQWVNGDCCQSKSDPATCFLGDLEDASNGDQDLAIQEISQSDVEELDDPRDHCITLTGYIDILAQGSTSS